MEIFNVEREKERLFILRLMKFTFQIAAKTFPDYLQSDLDEFYNEGPGYFTKNITRAIMIFIDNFDPEDFAGKSDLVNLSTQLNEMKSKYSPETFLAFLAHFSIKSISEFYEDDENYDSPKNFYVSILEFLVSIRQENKYVDFWGELEEAAKEVIADDRIQCKHLQQGWVAFNIEMTEENEFILEVMNYIFDLYMRNLPYYMDEKLEEFRQNSNNLLTTDIKTCLTMTLIQQAYTLRRVCETSMRHYYNSLVTESFNEADFIEMCVCYTRKAVTEFCEQWKMLSPIKVFDVLSSTLQNAKDNGKFTTFEKMNEAALRLTQDDYERTRDQMEHLGLSRKTEPGRSKKLDQGTKRAFEESSSDNDVHKSAGEGETSKKSESKACKCCTCC